ncbi:nicotinate (nicotinamide) nucleotide adenylyltransferase [Bartonella bacilliformis str. Heidi Mejia]|uniref:Probable nicotinate-nucleotide adenylyltransferase n=2 Tax=Bartonella bacilliformis TaxID=774 RepID=A1URN7_BARBK|nr:nicotinate-nucleotide adenylyltransferase [Bartonella bacilliformis]ABM44674.1 nicotinate (nicotinamide) nucleotide adenylyltransferase [Bartonella bacilliformis KC583]AMG85489.1 nicotinate-nucleotide adenylyltransferase [Bartonella bacilliformis]EKS45758.1 nicotinic acid mononucleotide adenylyltransferase [Bartonella bacilliformis INS]EYS90224.1 nicotinate (nicotinamide) nucleotide adenylyltransferase [Bartonella bacilliformis San Pedro600-02]EYS92388.1 nicotinate (nicotinamide) nucleotide
MPYVERSNIVGLFGGSFNPPHAGHLLVAKTAVRRLYLNQLWWMVTPGNPLKDCTQLPSLHERIRLSSELTNHPKIRVTGFEGVMGSKLSAETVSHILTRHSEVNFVWVMGADILATIHYWHRWRDIVSMLPIVIIDRPSVRMAALSSPMARTYRYFRLDERKSPLLPFMRPPAWTYLHGPLSFQSSTKLRLEGK